MKKITEENCIELIKEKFPKFISYWESYVNDFGSDPGLFIGMLPLGRYAMDTIKSDNTSEIENIFDFVEFLIVNGDQTVQNAIATGFLEYLLNQDPDNIKFSSVVKYLGKESIAYCRAWDEFTGMKTEGLWG